MKMKDVSTIPAILSQERLTPTSDFLTKIISQANSLESVEILASRNFVSSLERYI